MRIARTRFRDFRNLAGGTYDWDSGVNLLTGANGAGKTNVLEALHVLTGWGCFPGSRSCDAVKWGAESASLAAQMEGEKSSVVAVSMSSRASLKLDGKSCRWGDLRGCVQSLSFLPADMALIEGPPAVRRRFLDVICALYFPLYAFKLSEYKRIARHRRHLLAVGHSVRVTDVPMASLAAWIWECRAEVVGLLRGSMSKWDDLLPGGLSMELGRGGAGNREDPLEDFEVSCSLSAERERRACTPLVGPHRDDLLLDCGGRPAADAFSRGQRRRAALALVMSAASSIEQRYRASPVLLLDEVASELDAPGRSVLFECLRRSGWQCFAATAEKTQPDFSGTVWRVDGGRIDKM